MTPNDTDEVVALSEEELADPPTGSAPKGADLTLDKVGAERV